MTQTKAQNMAAEIWKTIICQILSVTATHSSCTAIKEEEEKKQQQATKYDPNIGKKKR